MNVGGFLLNPHLASVRELMVWEESHTDVTSAGSVLWAPSTCTTTEPTWVGSCVGVVSVGKLLSKYFIQHRKVHTGEKPHVLSYRACIKEHHRVGGLNNRNLIFPEFQGLESPRWRCRPPRFLERALFLTCRWLSFSCVCAWWRQSSGLASSYAVPSPRIRAQPLRPHWILTFP